MATSARCDRPYPIVVSIRRLSVPPAGSPMTDSPLAASRQAAMPLPVLQAYAIGRAGITDNKPIPREHP